MDAKQGRGLIRCAVILLMLAPGTCTQPTVLPPPTSSALTAIDLPDPLESSDTSLEEALRHRRSVRSFDSRPLTLAEIGQLLWAAQGLTSERGFRTAPSAGALYPLELYVAIPEGVFQYDPQGHHLLTVSNRDSRQQLYEAGLEQDALLQAPAVFVITAVFQRTEHKYGAQRSPRYVHLEAGHAAQNLLLQVVALELGAVPIGAFHDGQVQRALGLPADHEPLYLIPVGHLPDSARLGRGGRTVSLHMHTISVTPGAPSRQPPAENASPLGRSGRSPRPSCHLAEFPDAMV